MRDMTRKIANLVGIISTLMSFYYWYYDMQEECYFISYIGTSFYFLFLTLSFHRNRTKENAVLYSIIRHSKHAKKIVTKDNSIKGYGESDNLDKEGTVVFFTDDMSKVGRRTGTSSSSTAVKAISAASVFMDLPFSEAYELCCKPFKLDGDSRIRITNSQNNIEYVRIIDGWFNPGPSVQEIIINDTRRCIYNDECNNSLYNSCVSFLSYLAFGLAIYLLFRLTGLIIKLFKTPIMTEEATFSSCIIGSTDSLLSEKCSDIKSNKYMKMDILGENTKSTDGLRLKEIRITKNIYVSKFRVIIAILYFVILFCMYSWTGFKLGLIKGTMADSNNLIRQEGVHKVFLNGVEIDKIETLVFLTATTAIKSSVIKKYIIDEVIESTDEGRSRERRDVNRQESSGNDVSDLLKKQRDTKTTGTGELQVKVNSTYSEKLRIVDIGYLDETGKDDAEVTDDANKIAIKGSPEAIVKALDKMKTTSEIKNITLSVCNDKPDDIKDDDKSEKITIDIDKLVDDKIKQNKELTPEELEAVINNIDLDEVTVNENIILDLTCIYDEVLYVTTGSLKARCHIDKNNPGIIMMGKIYDDTNVKTIDDECYAVYNLQLARIGKPNCVKICKKGNLECNIKYKPNLNKNISTFMLSDGFMTQENMNMPIRYEEIRVYLPMEKSSNIVKKDIVDSMGNVFRLSPERFSTFLESTLMTFNNYEERVQILQDDLAAKGEKPGNMKDMGFDLVKPSNIFKGSSLDEKRKDAKSWITKYNMPASDRKKPISETFKNNDDAIKVSANSGGNKQTQDIQTIDMKGSISSFGEGTYISKNNFFTQFDDIFSGAVFLAENGEMDSNCASQYGDKYKIAACSYGRRQIISCEPNLWGEFEYGNSFKCRKPTNEEAKRVPSWRLKDAKIDYSLPEKYESRELSGKSGNVAINFNQNSYNGNVTLLWGKSYQDNIQQTGNLKYFIYSFVVRVEVTGRIKGSETFVRGWDLEIDNFNRWETREFDNKYKLYKTGPMAKANNIRKVPESCLSIESIGEPGGMNDMLQDRSRLNMVIKSDVYNENMELYKRTGTADCNTDRTKKCVYIIPIYYAIRLYGPAKAKVRVFGLDVEDIAFSNDICSSANAISVKGICYIHDETHSSTDVMVGGYPWTSFSGIALDKWNAPMEIPSFYLNHPKIGSGQYLSKVSTTANIGSFSSSGKCQDTYYEKGTLMCDGNKAAAINMVEYSTFHRPLSSMPNCTVKKHEHDEHMRKMLCTTTDKTRFVYCNHNPSKALLFKKECKTEVTKKLELDIKSGHGFTIKTPLVQYQVQKGSEHTKNKIHYVVESWYRSTAIVSIMLILSGIGYIMMALHLLFCVLCYINGYNIGRLIRLMGMGCILKKNTVLECNICEMYIYNNIEKEKHALCCKKYWCPYCITLNKNDDLCSLSFKNRNSFREHMKLHNKIRKNPYSGYISARRNKVVAFKLVNISVIVLLSLLIGVFGDIPQEESGLRSNRVGTVLNIDNQKLKCDNNKCSIMISERGLIPLVDGSSVILRAEKDGKKYANKFTIKNPKLITSCTYQYSSPHIKRGDKRLVYCCTGKSDCNANDERQILQQPIGGNAQKEDYIPMDTNNPLKSLDCPKAIACRSPIIDFMWLTAGCYSVNDGTAVGYEYYMPDIKKPMVHVMKCKINDMKYTTCNDDTCKEIKGQEEGIEKGSIKFEHIKNNLPVEFNIGVVSVVGETIPDHIFYNLPDTATNTANTVLAYKLNKIPQGDTCLPGSEYNDGVCEINESGSSPNLLCKSTTTEPTSETLSKLYESLNDVYHCNFEESKINWNVDKIKRSLKLLDKDFNDEQTFSWPSLELVSKNCMFGNIEVDLMSMDNMDLEIVKYTGTIISVKCTGYYNRNQKTILSFNLDKNDGLMEFVCSNSFTDTCVFDTAKEKTCNVTTLLPFVHICQYNGKDVTVDCSSLSFAEADPTSGHSIGWTGSEALMTWPSGIKIMLTNWWGMGLCLVAIFFSIILILWVAHLIRTATHAYHVSKMTGRRLKSMGDEAEHVMLDEDLYNTIVSRHDELNEDMTNNSLRRRLDGLGSRERNHKHSRSRGSMFD
ncbi:glycoprotein precursor [Wuhan Insect virus 2]|uniref:Glycoprotein n=1 Tax=Wuhan Insect virus 2 TaxID=1608107 RepID=A0A0B5KFI5_9VIRU|nr:glycoprotein precursor [Wuhan Insect virus 2]AJG39294.2 glycoprotein precursor [Wuhan Insect virus 2]